MEDEVHLKERQELMSEVLTAVKNVQSRFGGRSELATEENPAVRQLCNALQNILQHRIATRGQDVLRNTLNILKSPAGSSGTGGGIGAAPPFWTYVKTRLSKHEFERYMMLKQVSTDGGRGRAWLRSALNEHSLERFMHSLTSDTKAVSTFYTSGAFLLDHERSSMLPQIASGVGSILFAINIDNAALDTGLTDAENESAEPEFVASSDLDEEEGRLQEVQPQRKKKVSRQVVLFNDELRFDEKIDLRNQSQQQTLSESNFERLRAKLTNSPVVSNAVGNSAAPSQIKQILQPKVMSGEVGEISEEVQKDEVEFEVDRGGDNGSGSLASEDIVSVGELSIDSASNDNGSVGGGICKLTPMKDECCLGPLIPVIYSSSSGDGGGNGGGMGNNSSDSASLDVEDEADYATAATSQTVTRAPSIAPSTADSTFTTISREELKGALLSVMARKDELADQVKHLKSLLDKEVDRSSGLSNELSEVRKKSGEVNDKAQARIQTLTRENDLLKHQLKKYVSAVMKLRDGPQAYETLAKLEGRNNKTVSPSQEEPKRLGSGGPGNGSEASTSGIVNGSVHSISYVDYHFEASEYEKKLVQVAEMHGELLEFNEHLQKSIKVKDCVIKRLHEELVELRGPLPDDRNSEVTGETSVAGSVDEGAVSSGVSDVADDARSIASIESVTAGVGGGAGGRRPLIHIWVPSVFMSGSGQNTHHVYQVYLRIREEEWNIYRRYSEFYAFHQDLLKRDEALVKNFDFPPKKSVGNKAGKVVEDRRKRLQVYLRKIVNLMVQTNPSLAVKPDKEHVILLMPFLGDNMRTNPQQSNRSSSGRGGSSRVTNARKSLFQRRSTGSGRSERNPAAVPEVPTMAV